MPDMFSMDNNLGGSSTASPTTPASSNIDWNRLMQAAMQFRSSNQQQGMQPLVPQPAGGQGAIYQQNVPMFGAMDQIEPDRPANSQGTNEALNWLMKLYMGGQGGASFTGAGVGTPIT